VAAIGQRTTPAHNEVVLMAGTLGLSTLVCLLNNGNNGQTETAANLLGPFWRMNSPRTESGGSIVRSPTPGPAMFVTATIQDQSGKPIEGAEVDVWHSSPDGFYEQQDPNQAHMNLRGKFMTDAKGQFQIPQREAGRLSDSERRAGRRSDPRPGPPSLPPGAPALPDFQARFQDADLANLCQ
jgi:protocatechuate 3,4-dioxygenase beta subunit